MLHANSTSPSFRVSEWGLSRLCNVQTPGTMLRKLRALHAGMPRGAYALCAWVPTELSHYASDSLAHILYLLCISSSAYETTSTASNSMLGMGMGSSSSVV